MADEKDTTNERAEKGREILKSRSAQGEPGTKQPAHKNPNENAQAVVDELKALSEKHAVPTRGPSAGKTENHPVPPHERTTSPITGGGIAAAAGAIAAAQAHLENELTTEARLASDPRRELDQKKFEMGQRGELQFVPPAPEEMAAGLARLGVSADAAAEVADQIPKTPQEQVARDMPRLKQAEETAKQVKGGANINPTVEAATRDNQIRTGAGKSTVGETASTPARAESPTTAADKGETIK